MKLVIFTKLHTYGGWVYKPGDMLECPKDRAELLKSRGVVKFEKSDKKEG